MSTAEPLSECNAPEHSQQSSGVLNFILSKLGRPSRNGSKSAASGKSGSTATSKQASDGLAMAEQAGDANQDGEEVQSLPKPEVAVVPDTFDFEGRRGRHGSAGVVPQSANGGSAGPQGRGAPLTHTLPVGDRSASDTAQWDFRRREARRNSRSAREWVRESNVQAPASDWSKDLTKYDPDAQPAEAAAATGNMQLVPTHFEEGGMRFRRRSKSAKEFGSSARESAGGDHQPRTRTSLEATGSQHGSKRSSFEAGLHQDLKATGSPRVSAEKIPRHANAGSTSDFLPTELIQRSRLFNTRANQPRE